MTNIFWKCKNSQAIRDQELFNWCIKWPHYTKFNVIVLDSSLLKQSYLKNVFALTGKIWVIFILFNLQIIRYERDKIKEKLIKNKYVE